MESKKRNRSWVVRAIIAFVLVLAILTFFSNTIMNMTIPKVTAQSAVWGNLSYTNNATASVEVANKQDIKGLDSRKVSEVLVSDYDTVNVGDVLVNLAPAEDVSSLDSLQTQLTALQREANYAARTPATATDYASLQQAITDAQTTLATAQATLASARNKDSVIASANSTISANRASSVSIQAEVDAASSSVEDLNNQISALNAQISTLQSSIDVLAAMGTPTPTPTPVGSTPATPTPGSIDDLCQQLNDYKSQLSVLQSQLSDAQSRLSNASSRLATINANIDAAQAQLDAANALPSVAAAQSAVTSAQSAVTSAQTALANQKVTDGIAADQAQDTINDRNKQIATLQAQIEKLQAQLNATSITATAAGTVYGVAVAVGDTLTSDAVILTILPEDSEYTASFVFDATAVQNLYVGGSLTTDSSWLSSCTITSIKPDKSSPRDKRVVKCELTGDYIYPGETITGTADKSNQNYENIVPASAVETDSTGTFVYVLEESSTPLGDKCIVHKVAVTVEATDGSRTAIKGEGISGKQIITRSETPLHDGDRVRLQDYTTQESQEE